jgi:hypothetical protein
VGAVNAGLSSLGQLDSASGGSLVRLLADEQETLAGLSGPRCYMVSNIGSLLVLQVGGKLLGGKSVRAEPEVVLGVENVPWIGQLRHFTCFV